MSGRVWHTGVIGVLTAVLIIGTISVAGTYFPNLRLPSLVPDKGTLIVKLTDAPVELEHLNVTISNISVQRTGQGAETGENLPFVGGVSEVYVDILALQDESQDLSIAQLAPGNYTKIRMTITTANATYIDGRTVNLIVPPGHTDVIVHFEIKAGQATTVLIDMQADWVAISQSGTLRPELKATVISGQ